MDFVNIHPAKARDVTAQLREELMRQQQCSVSILEARCDSVRSLRRALKRESTHYPKLLVFLLTVLLTAASASAAVLTIDGVNAPLTNFSTGCPSTSLTCLSFPAQDYGSFTVGAADGLGPRFLIGDFESVDTMKITGLTLASRFPTGTTASVTMNYNHTFALGLPGNYFYGFRMFGSYDLTRSDVDVLMGGSGIFDPPPGTLISLGEIVANIVTNPNFSVRRPPIQVPCTTLINCTETLSNTFTAEIFDTDTLILPGSLDTCFATTSNAVEQCLDIDDVGPIPEPGTLLLLSTGLAFMAGWSIRRTFCQGFPRRQSQ